MDEYEGWIFADVRLLNTALKFFQRLCNVWVSTRVLVRPIGFDMLEVGGSNPPGPLIF